MEIGDPSKLNNAQAQQQAFAEAMRQQRLGLAQFPNAILPKPPINRIAWLAGSRPDREPQRIKIDWDGIMPVVWTVLGMILALLSF